MSTRERVSSKRERERESVNSDFIFMCNGKTKPECYRDRIFGLPLMKVEVVKKIKEGTHLYLYVFDLKLLYGTYKATSDGELDLEPIAFKGKFPAQVRFKNSKDCSPLHESRFRTAIIDNYQAGGKFKQELNNKQVRALNQMFRPISSASHHHQREVARTGSYPSPIREEGSRTRPQECVYLPGTHCTRAFPLHVQSK